MMASSPISHESPRSASQEILTPTRKIQALLARFDDSDSDASPSSRVQVAGDAKADKSGSAASSDSSDDEDDLPITGMSRMAARLLGNKQTDFRRTTVLQSAGTGQEPEAQDNVVASVNEQHAQRARPAETSEDELTRPAPRRRLLLKRKRSSAVPSSPVKEHRQPPSPQFFTSPANRPDTVQGSPGTSQTAGSKFKALVEKHRKARMEKEAAEAAKRAAAGKQSTENPPRQRGSSPADDSDEESDDSNVGAAQRLTKDAKPTRKASKKAMNEMKRETQRMNRNMQLAHQARTKKKITKESLLAKFNFSVPAVTVETESKGDQSATASSELESDVESLKGHETPPTSPPQDPLEFDKPMADLLPSNETALPLDTSNLVVEAPTLEALGLEVPQATEKGKGKAADWAPQQHIEARHACSEQTVVQTATNNNSRLGNLGVRARVAEMLKIQREKQGLEETDDLEVITGRGSVRKYAAFERLPKRKARETPSHLALRALAHLHDNDRNNHSSMTASEMQTSLRRAARLQAIEERQQKIAELKAKGVVIQTAEERERDQQEVEDLVERARQEAAEISKRERALAKKDGTFVKDGLVDDEDSDDEDFEEEAEDDAAEEMEDESEDDDGSEEEEDEGITNKEGNLVDELADEADTDEDGEQSNLGELDDISGKSEDDQEVYKTPAPRRSRSTRFVVDDEDEPAEIVTIDSPALPQPAKTPQSLSRSARRQIPGLQMSDELPLGLTQAFAATMADSQSQDDDEQTQQQDSLHALRDLPSPNISMAPQLNRLDSLDIVSDSQPASQTQPLNINLSFSQSQKVPESPSLGRQVGGTQFTPSQLTFEPTQDGGYMFSPFQGSRFASETPQHLAPHSTVDTVIVPDAVDASPIMQRKGRLQRGRIQSIASDEEAEALNTDKSAFEIMRRAGRKGDNATFDKSKSKARNVVDEAAEESDDEYAGLGGASDDDGNDEENEDDREMIDHDTQIGKGDEGKLAGIFADRERKDDEAAVSKLLKDITTGALRRKRGANDDLDLSDEEDAVARRREAKRREFAKMRRELLKDEAVGKIAEDKKKEAFLKSIEDRETVSDDDEDFDQPETLHADSAQESQPQGVTNTNETQETLGGERKRPLEPVSDSQLNRLPPSLRRTPYNHKPATLSEIRESVSFLIEEPDSQANIIDLGLSDSEDEPEAYVNLDRHLKAAEADENAAFEDEEEDDLGDFIINDDGFAKSQSEDPLFKKPSLPLSSQTGRATFTDRRTHPNVVNRLSLLRQSSSTSSNSSSSTTKLAFYSATTNASTSSFKVPSLLRRATTNSSISSSSSDKVSATGVTTSRTERGHVSEEKEFIRKGTGGRRSAVNYRPTVKEERMSARAGVQKKVQQMKKNGKAGGGKGGFLGGLFRGDSWG